MLRLAERLEPVADVQIHDRHGRVLEAGLVEEHEHVLVLEQFALAQVVDFNQQMRLIALEKGFTLNEYEVCKVLDSGDKGPPIRVKNEQAM